MNIIGILILSQFIFDSSVIASSRVWPANNNYNNKSSTTTTIPIKSYYGPRSPRCDVVDSQDSYQSCEANEMKKVESSLMEYFDDDENTEVNDFLHSKPIEQEKVKSTSMSSGRKLAYFLGFVGTLSLSALLGYHFLSNSNKEKATEEDLAENSETKAEGSATEEDQNSKEKGQDPNISKESSGKTSRHKKFKKKKNVVEKSVEVKNKQEQIFDESGLKKRLFNENSTVS